MGRNVTGNAENLGCSGSSVVDKLVMRHQEEQKSFSLFHGRQSRAGSRAWLFVVKSDDRITVFHRRSQRAKICSSSPLSERCTVYGASLGPLASVKGREIGRMYVYCEWQCNDKWTQWSCGILGIGGIVVVSQRIWEGDTISRAVYLSPSQEI